MVGSCTSHPGVLGSIPNCKREEPGKTGAPCVKVPGSSRVPGAPASLPPASSSLTPARRMDGFCNQNADQLGSLAGSSLLTVYVGVVECASASPYTYSTHRFPDELTPIEATPLSATSAELGLGLGLGSGLGGHSSSYAPSPSRHPPFTHYPFPLRSLVCGGQPSPHKPRLVVSHSTCPPLSSSPHAHSFVLGTAVINTHIKDPRRIIIKKAIAGHTFELQQAGHEVFF